MLPHLPENTYPLGKHAGWLLSSHTFLGILWFHPLFISLTSCCHYHPCWYCMSFEHFLMNKELFGSYCSSEKDKYHSHGSIIFFVFLECVQEVTLVTQLVYILGNFHCNVINNMVTANAIFIYLPKKLLCFYLFLPLISPMGTKENDFLYVLVASLQHVFTVRFICLKIGCFFLWDPLWIRV